MPYFAGPVSTSAGVSAGEHWLSGWHRPPLPQCTLGARPSEIRIPATTRTAVVNSGTLQGLSLPVKELPSANPGETRRRAPRPQHGQPRLRCFSPFPDPPGTTTVMSSRWQPAPLQVRGPLLKHARGYKPQPGVLTPTVHLLQPESTPLSSQVWCLPPAARGQASPPSTLPTAAPAACPQRSQP